MMIELNSAQMSSQEIIELIRGFRDERIHRLLAENNLMFFIEENYETFLITAIKKEFIKRDLKELQKSSLDLVHYSSLIRQVKEKGELGSVDGSSLFHKELDTLFRKYGL